jgi:hypothetical protein
LTRHPGWGNVSTHCVVPPEVEQGTIFRLDWTVYSAFNLSSTQNSDRREASVKHSLFWKVIAAASCLTLLGRIRSLVNRTERTAQANWAAALLNYAFLGIAFNGLWATVPALIWSRS